ncbi:amidohydrolase family protein [Pseudactinotalea sp. Z1739]|uniref:amidohydrolase family protein n=1 Tax=Pseudactinotalea sp. Z1739 TaxID=3413028 RepID=UPI003C7CCEC2
MLRIDTHHHVWDEAVRPQEWMDAATRGLIGGPYDFGDWHEAARENAVDFGIFVQTVAQPEETSEILALAPSQDGLAGVVGWIDVEGSRPPGDLLTEVRILPAATRRAAASPGTRIMLDHLSKPTMARADFDSWAADIRDLARPRNGACKLSGYLTFDEEPMTAQRLRRYAETVLESFGPTAVVDRSR